MSRRGRGVVAALALLVAGLSSGSSQASGVLRIEVLSNRADLISGGDALVQVDLPSGVSAADVTMQLGDTDVTDQFGLRPNGKYQGLLTGLALGPNVLKALLPGGSGAQITITNHPIGGPIFSGPQIQPWICTTEANGLGPAQDAQCNAPTKYEFFYKDKATGEFQPYDRNNPPPPGTMAQARTDEGVTVPFIVRVETGTIDRGIYQIGVLYDPTQPWEPWAPQRQWNRKLYYPYGASCGANYDQGGFDTPVGPLRLGAQGGLIGPLEHGFAVAISTLNILGRNCNVVVSAEATVMVQERLKESLGEVRYTLSLGCSGGSISQYEIADQYPGLLQGIRPQCSFPDIWVVSAFDSDCDLLGQAFNRAPQLWANALQREAVYGKGFTHTCNAGTGNLFNSPTSGCGSALAPAEVYDAQTNPEGARCSLSDYYVNILGRRPPEAWGPVEKKIGRGFAARPYDNVGVQYGLGALQSGDISPEQFVDLNEKVGGWDIDNNPQAERTVADTSALERMYRSGQITYGRELRNAAILDIHGNDNEDVHANVHPYITRARLIRSNGTGDNQALWEAAAPAVFANAPHPTAEQSLAVMDRWLAAVEADHRDISHARKIIENKPPQAVDSCWVGPVQMDATWPCQTGGNADIFSIGRSATLYAIHGTPRLVAGMPPTHDVLKCQLKPLQRSDYLVSFTDAQWQRLQTTFPTGVCDWNKLGVGQQPPLAPWLTYENGPGGEPLGPPPESTAL